MVDISAPFPAEAYTTLVSSSALAAHLDDPRWVIVDCRFDLADVEAGRCAYQEAHLPGARYAHLDEDLSAPRSPGLGRHPLPQPRALAARLGAWGIDRQTQVVVYDDSAGAIAVRLWWMLRWLGHGPVALLDGGYRRWCQEGRPVTAAPPVAGPASYRGAADAMPWLDTAAVAVQAVHAHDYLLIDARSAVRFRGEEEPIDPVAGPVPGAVNLPYGGNLDRDGRFLPARDLRRRFESLLAGRPAERVVHMCGSGVSACHNLLAMEIAGLPGSRLYPGSWSEWIADPGRAIARGAP